MRRRGFSLLEVLLGSILFSGALIYVAVIWGVHSRAVSHSRSRMMAGSIAAQLLEDAITQGYNNVANDDGTQDVTTVVSGQLQVVTYTWHKRVQNGPEGDSREVDITVEFAEKSNLGNKGTITVSTLVANV